MNGRKINILWLILPSVVFFLMVAAFVFSLGRNQSSSTESPTVSPTPIVFPEATPQVTEGLPSLVQQIEGWQLNDPHLAPPAVDRKISLPEE